jgi:hypothetical protein
MTRPMRYLLLALVASPALAYLIYRLAKGLGFFDPPWSREHELRRTILVAVFAFMLFLPVFFWGYANAWPRVWAVFGVVNGLALAVFAAVGIAAARRLWILRHPNAGTPPPASDERPTEELTDRPLS